MNNEDNKTPLQNIISNGVVNNNNINESTENEINNIETINDNANIEDSNVRKTKPILADSDLLYNFMGNNYQKFVMRSFNFPALIFSFIYLLFRKMNFYSFIVMVVYFLISIFIKNPYYLYGVVILIHLVLFIGTNKLYMRFSRTKIDNIRYKNSTFNNELILLECKKKGGTSILNVIFGLIINILVISALLFCYFYFITKTPVDKIYNKVLDLYNNNKWELKMNNSADFIEESIIESFNKANDSYKEDKLTFVAYLGEQIVSGNNYMFLCESNGIYKIVVLYVDLAGNSSFTYVNDFDFNKYVNKNIEPKVENNVGGWDVRIPGRAVVLESMVQESFDKVQNKLTGVTYYPIVVFENNDNYAIICYGRMSDLNETTGVYVMTIEKNSDNYSIASVDLNEYSK